jgi:hypothetical protein
MIFAEAIEFSRKFPNGHPKIFKGLFDWRLSYTDAEGYVVLTDAGLIDKSSSYLLKEYIKSHKLRVERFKDYLIICSLY